MVDDHDRIAALLKELISKSGKRVAASLIPDDWTEEQAIRLSRVVNKTLEAGEAGLRTVEDAMSG